MKRLTLKNIIYTILSIVGNPFYTFVAFLYTVNSLNATEQISTNIQQVNLWYLLLILSLIFIVRLYFYQFIILGRVDTTLSDFNFYEVFIERHKFQFLGVILFVLYLLPIEGNIFGFVYLPITFISILIVNTITILRLFKIKRKYKEINDEYK